MAELYQKQAEDADDKSTKLAENIMELQNLLKEASDRYGALEDHFEKEKVEHKDELKRRNDAIRALRKELEEANKLIETIKHQGNGRNSLRLLEKSIKIERVKCMLLFEMFQKFWVA